MCLDLERQPITNEMTRPAQAGMSLWTSRAWTRTICLDLETKRIINELTRLAQVAMPRWTSSVWTRTCPRQTRSLDERSRVLRSSAKSLPCQHTRLRARVRGRFPLWRVLMKPRSRKYSPQASSRRYLGRRGKRALWWPTRPGSSTTSGSAGNGPPRVWMSSPRTGDSDCHPVVAPHWLAGADCVHIARRSRVSPSAYMTLSQCTPQTPQRHTDTDRHRHRHTQRETQRHTHRHTRTVTHTETHSHTDTHRHRQTHRHTLIRTVKARHARRTRVRLHTQTRQHTRTETCTCAGAAVLAQKEHGCACIRKHVSTQRQ